MAKLGPKGKQMQSSNVQSDASPLAEAPDLSGYSEWQSVTTPGQPQAIESTYQHPKLSKIRKNKKKLTKAYYKVMHATKRKFHTLLDAIAVVENNTEYASLASTGASCQTNASASGPSAERANQTKKQRTTRPVSVASSTSARLCRLRQGTGSIGALVSSSGGNIASGSAEFRKSPNYAPWNREQFLARMETYRKVTLWGSKPARINELQWAKRGWSCVGKERVGCVGGCGKEVYVKLYADRHQGAPTTEGEAGVGEVDWTQAKETELVNRYARMIIGEHEEGCFWRTRGCDAAIYRLSLSPPRKAIASLKTRYQLLAAMGSALPSTIVTPEGLDVDRLIREVPADFARESDAELDQSPAGPSAATVNARAFKLALFGWQADVDYLDGMVSCDVCFRRLGLWLFTNKPKPDDQQSGSGSDGEEGTATLGKLSVVTEHREYCPWVNTGSQNGIKAKDGDEVGGAGWEVMVRALDSMHNPPSRLFPFSPAMDSTEAQPATSDDGLRSEVASTVGTHDAAEGQRARDAKDKERWAKLKKLKKIFDIKPAKKKPQELTRSMLGA